MVYSLKTHLRYFSLGVPVICIIFRSRAALLKPILPLSSEVNSTLTEVHPDVFSFGLCLQPSVRLLSLRVLRDMVRTKPHAFDKQNDKMIETVLNAHKDSQKEVKSSFTKLLS